MTTIQNIFAKYGPEYLERYKNNIPRVHKKTMDAIIQCRTPHFGVSIYACEKCGRHHRIYRSCGNRHCPSCQYQKSRQWLEKQLERMVPGHHFLVTFTVPDNLRRFIRSHPSLCYGAMFAASAGSMKKLALDQKYIGGDLPGFTGVLHTWGRMLQYHPHIHYIVPGGALLKKDMSWHCSRADFYLPVKALSKIFKAMFRDQMKKAGLLSAIPSDVWEKGWNVNCRPVGSGRTAMTYLAPYVFKVAISNSRIVNVKDRKVFFKYKKSGSNRRRTTAFDVMEFIRRFLQHVLPSGFMKVRHYGFMSSNASVPLSEIRALIVMAYGFLMVLPKPVIKSPTRPTCPHCGADLYYKASILPHQMPPPKGG